MSKKIEKGISDSIVGLILMLLSICLICITAIMELNILIALFGIIVLIIGTIIFIDGLKTMIITYSQNQMELK